MNRRSLFTITVPIGLLIAGCLGRRAGSNGSGDDGPTVRETSFEVLDVRSSSEDETVSVTFDNGSIAVTGTIRGNNGCYTARLADAAIADDTLTVSVESYEDVEEDQDCTQAVVVVEYQAVVVIDGTPPASVTVEHNGSTVST